MSDQYRLLFALCAVWAAIIAVRGVRAIRAGEGYKFSSWEGFLFTGRSLTRMATRMKTGLAAVVAVSAALVGAGIGTPAFELAMGAACIMIINDLVGKV